MSESTAPKNTYSCPWNHTFDVLDPPVGESDRIVCPLCGSIRTRVTFDMSPVVTTQAEIANAADDDSDTIDATIAGPHADTGTEQAAITDSPRYRTLDELGRGACGVVYRVRDEKLGRDVALKQLLRFSPRALQQFKQEFRTLANISHPNLAALYDLNSDGDEWSFTMELLDAVEFNEYVWSELNSLTDECQIPTAQIAGQGTRLADPVVLRLHDALKQLSLGLNALHTAGVLHRDIKHSNVMVTTEGRVVLVDFGLAVEMSSHRSGVVQGTPAFMAPEQCAGTATSPATDWYAVGVILYEVLTGRLPFTGQLESILSRKSKELPEAPSEIEPSVPSELNDLCMGLLQIDPEARPTVVDVLNAIGASAEAESIQSESAITNQSDIELVGRDWQMQILHDHFSMMAGSQINQDAAVSENSTRLVEADSVFVHGRSGMGKSVLVERFLQEIQEQSNALVLSGRCYEQESVPFKALDSLMDSLATYLSRLRERTIKKLIPDDSRPLARVFPVLGQLPTINDPDRPSIENAEQQELRQRAMNGLRELLKRLGERKRPLVLYIDDLQWGDVDSANLLVDLIRPPNSPRLLLVGSYRTEAIGKSPCLIELVNEYESGEVQPRRVEIPVEALTHEESTTLALKLLRCDTPAAQETATQIARESGGWPFFVWELSQGIQDDPEIAREPLELDDVIWKRACRLPEKTRRFLELVAVVAHPIPVADAYRALDEVEKGQSLLAQLRAASFIRTTTDEQRGTIVESYHDRIRESVASRLDTSTVQEHHLSMATTIEVSSGITREDRAQWLSTPSPVTDETADLTPDQWDDVFDLARHYSSGGHPEQALPYALIAAEQARRQDALEVSEQQFRIAELGADNAMPHIQFRIANGLGDVLMLKGSYGEAEHRLTAAHEVAADEITRAKTDRKLGELAFKRGRMSEAAEILETALRELGSWTPRSLPGYAVGLAWEGTVQILHTLLPSLFVHRRNEIATGAERVRLGLLSRLSYVNWFARGMVPTFWSHLAELNRAERYLPSLELAQAWSEHGPAMTMVPLHERGIRYATNSLKIRRAHGHRWGEAQSLNFMAMALQTAGRLREAITALEESVVIFERTGDWWEENLVRYQLALAHYRVGDLDKAIDLSQRVHRSGLELGDEQASGISLHCWALASQGKVPADIIQTELTRDRVDAQATAQVLLAEGVRLYYLDEFDRASELLDQAKSVILRNTLRSVYVAPIYSWRATILRSRLQQGPTTGAMNRKLLRQTKHAVLVARLNAWSYPVERPQALREAGELALLLGRRVKAVRFFQQSIDEAERLEMSYEADRTRRRMNDLQNAASS